MPDLLKYLIVDDDDIDRLAIECETKKFPFLKTVASCPHPLQAAEFINRLHHIVSFRIIGYHTVSL